jgi:transposase, IS5 family
MARYIEPTRQGGFFDYEARREELARRPRDLDKLGATIDWEFFREAIEAHLCYSEAERGGRPAFDPVFMFKVLVLQKYHALSEEETEFQILDRMSFQRFLGIGAADKVPDKNTIWVFKERLGEAGARALFREFDEFLREVGIVAGRGKIVDATFVEVPRQRNTREENAQIKQGETPEAWKDKPAKLRQKDIEARWGCHNDTWAYGYKNHIKAERKTKMIERYEVTEASVHDSQRIDALTERGRDAAVWGDAAFAGEPVGAMLRRKGIVDRRHEKGTRGRPLTERQEARNREKSRVRARVEHVFGFQVNSMGADWIRTIGIKRARARIGLGNLIYNLFRFKQLGYQM